jgi:hypothetical protein
VHPFPAENIASLLFQYSNTPSLPEIIQGRASISDPAQRTGFSRLKQKGVCKDNEKISN